MVSKARQRRRSGRTKQFAKDWRRLARSGRYAMEDLETVMRLLIENSGPLPPHYRDHALHGDWKDFRDCHVAGDWVLIYRLNALPDGEEVVFVRTGSHSELFE